MSSRQIRLATGSEADYMARAAVLRAFDNATTVEALRQDERAHDSKYRKNDFLVEVDGVAVATGSYHEWIWWYEAGRYVLQICVLPSHRRQGHGAALYATMRELLANENPAGTILMCKCPDDQPESIRFVLRCGFEQVGHDLHSELDVSEFDGTRFAQAERGLQEQGIEIVAYHELVARDPDFLRKFYDLSCLSMLDMPAGGVRTFPPFEHFARTRTQATSFLPDFFFMALDKGRYVGQSDLADEKQDRRHLGTGYTGVHPDYRRRGIATVLKARCIQRAKELGVKTIATGNDSTNPMYQLNLQLGFKPVPGDLLFEMRLAQP